MNAKQITPEPLYTFFLLEYFGFELLEGNHHLVMTIEEVKQLVRAAEIHLDDDTLEHAHIIITGVPLTRKQFYSFCRGDRTIVKNYFHTPAVLERKSTESEIDHMICPLCNGESFEMQTGCDLCGGIGEVTYSTLTNYLKGAYEQRSQTLQPISLAQNKVVYQEAAPASDEELELEKSAWELFWRKGKHKLSIDNLIDEYVVGKNTMGAIYERFKECYLSAARLYRERISFHSIAENAIQFMYVEMEVDKDIPMVKERWIEKSAYYLSQFKTTNEIKEANTHQNNNK